MQDAIIGERIRSFRERKDMSVENLAMRAGVAQEMLEAIEAGKQTPGLGYLVKIARALGERLGTFLDDKVSPDPFIVRKVEREGDPTVASCQGTCGQAYFSLGQGKTDRHMEPFFITLFKEEGEVERSSHEGEEFILVMSGKVRLVYGMDEYLLEEGDTMYFNSIVPHHVSAAAEGTDGEAKIFAVIYVPF